MKHVTSKYNLDTTKDKAFDDNVVKGVRLKQKRNITLKFHHNSLAPPMGECRHCGLNKMQNNSKPLKKLSRFICKVEVCETHLFSNENISLLRMFYAAIKGRLFAHQTKMKFLNFPKEKSFTKVASMP